MRETVTLYTDSGNYVPVYTVYDIYDQIIVKTTSRQTALHYFELAQRLQTVSRVWQWDRYRDSKGHKHTHR